MESNYSLLSIDLSPTSGPFFIPEWSRRDDVGSGCEGGPAISGLMTSTPLRQSSAPTSPEVVSNLSKPRELHLSTQLPPSESTSRKSSFIESSPNGRGDYVEGSSVLQVPAQRIEEAASSVFFREPGQFLFHLMLILIDRHLSV